MPNSGYIIPGYDQDAYPKIVAPEPKIYHRYLSMEALENIYDEETINNLFNKAYFVSNPDAFGAVCFEDAICEYVDKCQSGQLLVPGSKTKNQVIKSMRVKNLGKEKAWVRLFIAIPSILDDAQPTFDASKNVLHFNTEAAKGLAEGQWNYGKAMDRSAGQYVGQSGWNFYATEIKGIAFNVYVATRETALEPGYLSSEAVYQVYLDAECTADDIVKINKTFKSDKWEMFAVAEAITVAEDDTDAFAAFAKVYEEVGEGKHNPFA